MVEFAGTGPAGPDAGQDDIKLGLMRSHDVVLVFSGVRDARPELSGEALWAWITAGWPIVRAEARMVAKPRPTTPDRRPGRSPQLDAPAALGKTSCSTARAKPSSVFDEVTGLLPAASRPSAIGPSR